MLPTERPHPVQLSFCRGGLLFLSLVPLFLTHVTPQILLPANPSSFLSRQQTPHLPRSEACRKIGSVVSLDQ